jgi:hypothetical protein
LENGFLSSNSGFRGKSGITAVLGLEGDSGPHAFVMCPYSKNFNDAFLLINLVNEPMLDIAPAGISSGKITDQFFVRWWILERVFSDYFKKLLCFGL